MRWRGSSRLRCYQRKTGFSERLVPLLCLLEVGAYYTVMKLLIALALVFIVVPIMEFAVLIEVGRRIGTIYTLAVVFGAGLLGAFLARMEGLRIVTRIQDD